MINLLHGDCLELMKNIPDGSIDMVLCDLPYGTTSCKWDSVIPFEPLWKQYHRACKENAAVVLFSQMPFSAKLYMSNQKEFRYEWIWEKSTPSGFLNSHKMPLKYHEQVFVFYRKLPCYNPQFSAGKKYKKTGDNKIRECYKEGVTRIAGNYQEKRFPSDVLFFGNPSWGNDKGLHPTQKPVALLEYLIKTYTNMRGGSSGQYNGKRFYWCCLCKYWKKFYRHRERRQVF